MAVDALVALALLSLVVPLVLGSIKLSLGGEARASERRTAKAQLGYLLAANSSGETGGGVLNSLPRATLAVRLERMPLQSNDAGVAICIQRAGATNVVTRRTYQTETIVFCDEARP